ncbi:transposon-like protein [Pseudomonas sp. StFLB209]|nr:transposon-like protein [Pseudomonas sp. StFLB209]
MQSQTYSYNVSVTAYPGGSQLAGEGGGTFAADAVNVPVSLGKVFAAEAD